MSWINMRAHNRGLVYGDDRTVPQGFWCIVRIYRIGEYSQYWYDDRKEAVGGHRYNYDDHLVRAIKSNQLGSDGVSSIADTANDTLDREIFAILADETMRRYPQEDDTIYLIDKYASVDRPLPPYRVTDRYKIINEIKDHGDFGRSEAIYLLGERIHGES